MCSKNRIIVGVGLKRWRMVFNVKLIRGWDLKKGEKSNQIKKINKTIFKGTHKHAKGKKRKMTVSQLVPEYPALQLVHVQLPVVPPIDPPFTQ